MKECYSGLLPLKIISLLLYRHGDLGKVFANTVLHNAPQVEGVIWLVGNTAAPCPTELHVVGGVLRKHKTHGSVSSA